MEAAKRAVLQKTRPLALSFFVPALDGVVHAGERVLVEGGIYGEVCAFAPDLRAVPNEAWEHFSASDVRALQVHSAGMVQLRRLEVVGLVDRVDDEDTRKLAKGMLEVAPNFDHAALWWVPVESIEAVVIKLSFVGVPRPCFTSPSLDLCTGSRCRARLDRQSFEKLCRPASETRSQARAPRRDHTRPGRQDAGRPDTQSSVGGPLRRRNAGPDVGGDGRSSR